MSENPRAKSNEARAERMLRSGDWIDPMDPIDLTSLADRYARRRTVRVGASVLATAALVAGISVTAGYLFSGGGSSPQPPMGTSDQPIPWVDATPPKQEPPSACSPGKLTISLGRTGAWHGQATQAVEIRNDSGTACTLPTTISVAAITGQAKATPVDGSGLANVHPVALDSGESAALVLAAPASCGPPTHVADTLTVGIDAAPPTVLKNAWLPLNCGAPTVQDLYAEPAEAPTKNIPMSAKISAPETVQAGTNLKFTVTLTNDSDGPITFSECPFYLMGVKGPAATGGAYQLNCTVNPNLDARQSRTYEMVLDMPADAVGEVVLTWSLSGYAVGDEVHVIAQ